MTSLDGPPPWQGGTAFAVSKAKTPRERLDQKIPMGEGLVTPSRSFSLPPLAALAKRSALAKEGPVFIGLPPQPAAEGCLSPTAPQHPFPSLARQPRLCRKTAIQGGALNETA